MRQWFTRILARRGSFRIRQFPKFPEPEHSAHHDVSPGPSRRRTRLVARVQGSLDLCFLMSGPCFRGPACQNGESFPRDLRWCFTRPRDFPEYPSRFARNPDFHHGFPRGRRTTLSTIWQYETISWRPTARRTSHSALIIVIDRRSHGVESGSAGRVLTRGSLYDSTVHEVACPDQNFFSQIPR